MSMSKLTFKSPAPELHSVMVFIMIWPLPMAFKLSIMIIVEPVSQKLATKHDRFK